MYIKYVDEKKTDGSVNKMDDRSISKQNFLEYNDCQKSNMIDFNWITS